MMNTHFRSFQEASCDSGTVSDRDNVEEVDSTRFASYLKNLSTSKVSENYFSLY